MSTAHYQKLPQAHKFMIGSVAEPGVEAITVEAQYNPKELQIESPIKWSEHQVIGAQALATKPMEFSGMGAETVKVELVFDAFEDNSDFVVNAIAALKSLASVRDPYADKTRGKNQRPSFCVATWGTQAPFRCVIESINVKYTMFSFNGTPVRATVILGLKSGTRSIETDENSFEQASRLRLQKQRERYAAQRNEREADRARDERERAARYEAAGADRRLAEREASVNERQQQLEAERAQRRRDAALAEERIAREQRVAEQERQLAAREQRKKDFDLE